jgi:hypothetical protein
MVVAPLRLTPSIAAPSPDIIAAHSTLVAALVAAKATTVQEREWAAALTWEQECSAANTLARQLVQAERHLGGPSCPKPPLDYLVVDPRQPKRLRS